MPDARSDTRSVAHPDPRIDRALGALTGIAVGDAMGMPSQTLSRGRIRAEYGRITDFVAPFAGHPVSHGLVAASVTDDTEQSLLLARLIIAHPNGIDDRLWAKTLLDWEADIRARGLSDLLGPSSRMALDALMRGVPADQTGTSGTTNGAAMRITPVGIATPAADIPALVARVAQSCRVTHATREAIAAAAAVAAVVSQGVDGATFDAAIPMALAAARIGATMGAAKGEADMARRILAALAAGGSGDVDQVLASTGNSVASHQSIPAAFGVVVLAKGDPWQAALIAANFGDDTDTIGAIACSMAGACFGVAGFPLRAIARVTAVNRLELAPLVQGLLAVRQMRAAELERAAE